MRSGPERELVDDYLARSTKLARSVGVLGVEESPVDVSRCSDRVEETRKIVGQPDNTEVIVLDERGKSMTSRELAALIGRCRDDDKDVVFAIGAADGFEPSALPRGARRINLGTLTWPHKLVRAMMAEQIYRALNILAGTPYHRD